MTDNQGRRRTSELLSNPEGSVVSNSRESDSEWLKWKSATLTWRSVLAQALICVLTFVGAIIGFDGFDQLNSIIYPPKATITSPSEPNVPKTFRLTGTAENFNDSEILWAVSRRWADGKFYPQDKPCSVFPGAKFDCGNYYLGNQEGGDAGEVFDLIIIHAGIDAVKVFLIYQKGDIKRGLDDLPKDAKILERVQRTRV